MSERVYESVIRTALGLFRALDFQFEVDGVENLPDVGGAVLASNHVSYFDFMFVGLAARDKHRLVRFMAKKSVFDNKVSGPLMRACTTSRSTGGRCVGLRRRGHRAARRRVVGVFPESTISRAFVPRKLKSGAARMAMEADVPLLPVVVWGGQRVWTTGRKPELRRHVPVVIEVGATDRYDQGETPLQLTEVLHER